VQRKILVLGLGNRLLTDDGVGPLIVDALQARGFARGVEARVELREGGTLGLALLPEIEVAEALIVVDAARFGGAPGELRVFEGDAMDGQVGGAKSSVHEAGLADLMGAARFAGWLPERRALVGVAPEATGWGLTPTPAVAAAMPAACAAIDLLIERWAQ
jgi:hydrogenase maturation protease